MICFNLSIHTSSLNCAYYWYSYPQLLPSIFSFLMVFLLCGPALLSVTSSSGRLDKKLTGHLQDTPSRISFSAYAPSPTPLANLLVTSLHRAVSFVQMNHVAVLVADDLDFDVSRSFDELLQEQSAVAERCFCLGTSSLKRVLHLLPSQTHIERIQHHYQQFTLVVIQ